MTHLLDWVFSRGVCFINCNSSLSIWNVILKLPDPLTGFLKPSLNTYIRGGIFNEVDWGLWMCPIGKGHILKVLLHLWCFVMACFCIFWCKYFQLFYACSSYMIEVWTMGIMEFSATNLHSSVLWYWRYTRRLVNGDLTLVKKALPLLVKEHCYWNLGIINRI